MGLTGQVHNRLPLHLAVQRPAAVRALLERGAAVNARDGGMATALHLACLGFHQSSIVTLVELGAQVNLIDMEGRTPALCLAQELLRVARRLRRFTGHLLPPVRSHSARLTSNQPTSQPTKQKKEKKERKKKKKRRKGKSKKQKKAKEKATQNKTNRKKRRGRKREGGEVKRPFNALGTTSRHKHISARRIRGIFFLSWNSSS